MLDSDDDIHGLLTRVEVPAPTVDVADVVAQGQRRRHRRRLVSTATTISLVLLLAATSLVVLHTTRHAEPAKPRTCTAAPLPMPPGYNRGAYMGIDPTGRYMVGMIYNLAKLDTPEWTGDSQVLWTDGVPKVVSIPGETVEFLALPNAHGVGWGTTFNYPHTGVFRYRDGVITMLHSPVPDTWHYYGGYSTDDGTLVTFAEPQPPAPGRYVTIKWAPGAINGQTIDLLPFYSATARRSGNHLLVQNYPRKPGPIEYYVTDLDGHNPIRLSSPSGTTAQVGLTSGDWAFGDYYKGGDVQHEVSVRWDLRDGSYTVVDHEGPLNGRGWMLYDVGTGKNTRIVLDKSGTVVTLLPPPGFKGDFDATSLADDGTIVGWAARSNGSEFIGPPSPKAVHDGNYVPPSPFPTRINPDFGEFPVIWHC